MKSAFHYILVAEDDEDDQRLFIKHFTELTPGASVKFFKDGNEVVSFLEKCPSYQLPKVILLDYRMPIFNGNQVLKAITGNPRYNAIRKFVWSTSDNPDHIRECTTHGAERYFRKPNSVSELNEIIEVISMAYNGNKS